MQNIPTRVSHGHVQATNIATRVQHASSTATRVWGTSNRHTCALQLCNAPRASPHACNDHPHACFQATWHAL